MSVLKTNGQMKNILDKENRLLPLEKILKAGQGKDIKDLRG